MNRFVVGLLGTLLASVAYGQTLGGGTVSVPNFQSDPELRALAGVTSAADKIPYFTGSAAAATADFTAAGRALVDDVDAAAQRTTLGLGSAISGPVSSTDNAVVRFDGTGGDTLQNSGWTLSDTDVMAGVELTLTTDLALLEGGTGASTASAARTNLGLAVGTDVQAFDATLNSIAALGTAADKLTYTTGVDLWAEATLTASGRAILDDASTAAQRTTLGLGTGDSPTFAGQTLTGDLTTADGVVIKAATGGGTLDLRNAGVSGAVALSSDTVNFTTGWLYAEGNLANIGFSLPSNASQNAADIEVFANSITLRSETTAGVFAKRIEVLEDKIGFFTAPPVTKPTSTSGIKDSLVSLGLIADGGATPLDLDGGTLTGALLLPDGTFSLPSLANDGDINTGIYFPTADQIGFATGGTGRLLVTSSGIKIGAVGTAPDGSGLHIETGSAGVVTAHVDADEGIFEGSGNSGISIFGPNVNDQNIYFGSPAANQRAIIRLNSGEALLRIGTNFVTGDFLLLSGAFVEGMRIDSNQNVTKVKTACFSAFNNATVLNQTGSTSGVTVGFNTEIFDQGNDFAANTFTAPVAGRYLLLASVHILGITTAADLSLVEIVTSNRTYRGDRFDLVSGFPEILGHNVSALADMDSGDTAHVTISVSGEGGDTVDIEGRPTDPLTAFSGCLLA